MLLLAGALAVTLIGTVPPPVSEALWRVSPHEVSNMFARWDTFFYYTIATRGYSWNPAVFTYQDVVFFPLYPLLMRWGGLLLGGHPMIAGLVVSFAAFAGGLLLLYRLALLELGEDYAWRVVLLFAVFPYAMFFSTVYTESLFLFLTVAAFYAMRRQRVGWAAICGLLAGLTRPNGFWLALPLAYLAIWPAGHLSVSRTDGLGLGLRTRPRADRVGSRSPPRARRSSVWSSSRRICRSVSPTRSRGCTARTHGACRCSDAWRRPIPS